MVFNMRQRHIGVVFIIIGIFLSIFVYGAYQREVDMVDMHMQETGSCFLDDGTCLHGEINSPFYMLGFGVSIALAIFGFYIGFIDKTQEHMEMHQEKISKALKEASEKDSEKEAFNAFLSNFDDDEKRVLKAIHEQADGIKQSTLRFRTEMSKTGLSMMLKRFEDKGIVSRKEEGKTNRVFFVKRF